jgi:dipeptidyl aminopeptidase/acylaminoacyl peptidase
MRPAFRRHIAAAASLALLATPLALTQTNQHQNGPETNLHNAKIEHLIQHLQKTAYIRETAVSPNGKMILWEQGGQDSSKIFIAPLTNPSAATTISACSTTQQGSAEQAAWSPDSKQIAFFSDCTPDHINAVFIVSTHNNRPRKLATLDGYAHALAWAPNGKTLSFIYVKGAKGPVNALAPTHLVGVIGEEKARDQRIATVSAHGGPIQQITPAGLYIYEFHWAPNSSKLTYVAAPLPGDDNWWTAKLYTQTPTGKPQAILDPGAVSGPLHGLQIAVPRFSPNGKQIAFIGGLMSDQGVTGGDLYIIPASGGQPRNVTPGTHLTVSWIHWQSSSPARDTFIVTTISAGAPSIQRLDLSGDTYHFQPLMTEPESIGNGHLLNGVSLSSNGKVAFIGSSFSSAPEVYAGTLGEPLTTFTHINSHLKPAWGKAESVKWTNEGFHVQGWLLYPANYNPNKHYPLIVYVHGGPSYANMPHWPYAGYGPVPFSALGYFVLMPNPRGSYGEGEKFTQANRRDFGYGDLRDILAGVDAVEKRLPVDNNRVGITGWSYGGFMTMFAITQTHRFHAAVAGAGLSDWKSYYGENSIDQWMIPFFGASVYDDPAVYAKSSAINFIKNAKTPTLVVVGANDAECPAPQSFEFWHALKTLGVPTQLVVYPGEGHGFYKPADRVNVLERALAWFQHYMPAQN